MISHVTGQLAEVHEDSVVIERDGIGYIVLTPRYAIGELAAFRGRDVTLHTLLFFDNNQSGGLSEPQLIGFLHADDKAFFRRFISVKGIVPKKALKALAQPAGRVANWIENGDTKSLKQLPGIGARAAELIVAELKGKLHDLAVTTSARRHATATLSQPQRDALEIMVSLGDGRIDAEQWLERAGQLFDDVKTSEEWIRAAYKVKTGVLA